MVTNKDNWWKKLWRGFQRLRAPNLAKGTHQLVFEKEQMMLTGPEEDIKQVQRLDAIIGQLIRPFNDAVRVPDNVVEKVKQHVADVSGSLRNVGAYKRRTRFVSGLEAVLNDDVQGLKESKDYKQSLEYENHYTSANKSEICQRVIKIDIGPRRR